MSFAPVLFPDACQVTRTALSGLADPTFGNVPNPRPDRFYTVLRSGGPRRDQVTDNATIVIESWGPTESAAHDMAQLARRAITAAAGTVVDGVPVYRVAEAAGPGLLPDPVSAQPRYSQTFTVALRGT